MQIKTRRQVTIFNLQDVSSYNGIFGKYCFYVKAPLKNVSMLYVSIFAYTGNIVSMT